MSLLCAASPPPSAFIVSARLWVSNAALFHACARAACDASMPAPPRSESRVTPLLVFNRVLRFRFIDVSPKFEAAFYAFIAQGRSPPGALCVRHARGALFCPCQDPFDNRAGVGFGQLRLRRHRHRAPRSAAAVPELAQKPRRRVPRPLAGSIGPITLCHVAKSRSDDRRRYVVTCQAAKAPGEVEASSRGGSDKGPASGDMRGGSRQRHRGRAAAPRGCRASRAHSQEFPTRAAPPVRNRSCRR